MNFFEIIKQLAEVDSDVLGRLDSRRAVFSSLGTAAKRGAMAATPALLGAFFQKAYAGTSGTKVGSIADIFNYALTLELLEADFYAKMVGSSVFSGQTPAAQGAIRKIKQHEDAHVALLRAVLTGLGATTIVSGITFKAAAFPATWDAQLQVAQLLEDTGVRAYKGRAADLLAAGGANDATVNGNVVNPLQAALQIHSVEARHAAHIRYMRSQTPWISGNGDLDASPHYQGAIAESTMMQAGIDLKTVTTGKTYSDAEAAASFDEILTPAEVIDPSRAGALIQM